MKWFLRLSLLLSPALVCLADQTVKIFHINDLRYDIFQVKDDGSKDCLDVDPTCFGGLLRLQQLADTEILADSNDTTLHLWLDAGHVLGPAPAYDVLKFDVAAAIRELNFHASALGPEVFQYGLTPSLDYTQPLNETVVAANIKHESDVYKSLLVPLGEDCHAAIIGFVDKAQTDSMEVFGVDIEDEEKAVKDEIAAIKAAHTDKKLTFIALGSASIDGAEKLAAIPDLDFVVFSGGNFTGVVPPSLNYLKAVEVAVNASYTKTNYVVSVAKNVAKLEERFLVGTLEFTLDDACRPTTEAPVAAIVDYVLLDQTTSQASVDVVHAALDVMLATESVVAHSKVPLLPAADSCKVAECALGDLIADAMMVEVNEVTSDKPWSESVKLAVIPARLIQYQVNVTGAITGLQMRSFFAHDEYLYAIQVTGKTLKRMFDTSLVKEDGKMENYLQVSEYFHVEFDFDRNEAVKIDALSVNADAMQLTPVDLHDDVVKYVVAVPASMLFNTPAFDFLQDVDGYELYDATVADALLSHISKTSGSFLALPLTGTRTTESTQVSQLCVSNTGEVIILTLFVLALIVAFVVGLWKYVLPKYRQRRGSTTQLIP